MRRLPGIAVAVVAMALVVTGASVPAAAHDVPKRCGDRLEPGAGWFHLRAHKVAGCKAARRLAERWHDRAINDGTFARRLNVHQQTWRCRTKQSHPEVWRVRCSAPNRIVHFGWGF
jgi:hypothetical protein